VGFYLKTVNDDCWLAAKPPNPAMLLDLVEEKVAVGCYSFRFDASKIVLSD